MVLILYVKMLREGAYDSELPKKMGKGKVHGEDNDSSTNSVAVYDNDLYVRLDLSMEC